jgi:hypothetical protein
LNEAYYGKELTPAKNPGEQGTDKFSCTGIDQRSYKGGLFAPCCGQMLSRSGIIAHDLPGLKWHREVNPDVPRKPFSLQRLPTPLVLTHPAEGAFDSIGGQGNRFIVFKPMVKKRSSGCYKVFTGVLGISSAYENEKINPPTNEPSLI